MIQGDTRGDAHALVNTMADTLPKEEAVGDTWGDTHALVDNLAVTLTEVETVALGDARGSAQALVDTLSETRHTRRCASAGRHWLTR